jgi:hypothetical protein
MAFARIGRFALFVGVLFVAAVAIAPLASASPEFQAFDAIVRPSDVPGGAATYLKPEDYRTPYGLVSAWGQPARKRAEFTRQLRSAGYRVGSLGYVTGAGHSNWTSVAVVLRSHASAVSYIDSQHDQFAAQGYYSVTDDGSSVHAFRLIERDRSNRIVAVAVYAMRGDLVVLLQDADGSDLSALRVQIVMRLMLARSAPTESTPPPARTTALRASPLIRSR